MLNYLGEPNRITNFLTKGMQESGSLRCFRDYAKDTQTEAEGREEQRCHAAGSEDRARGYKPKSALSL